jgi:2-methylcitrate dehydratase PrpD
LLERSGLITRYARNAVDSRLAWRNALTKEMDMALRRRDVLGSGLVVLAGHAVARVGQAQERSPGAARGAQASSLEGGTYGAAATGLDITTTLARFLSRLSYDDLSPAAVHEAKRAVLDWVGCALAGSTHPTTHRLLATFDALGSIPAATVLGQPGRRLSLLDAAVANGQRGHVLDFDDTHLGGTILHTSTATLPALFALGERRGSSGRDLIVAFAAAFEAGIRVGQAAPDHHRGGWHLTGTLGSVAAAAASARLMELDAQQTTHALGIACTQAAGMQQNRGTDCKSLHAGKAAYHGVLAAMLASNAFDSSTEIIEGRLGFTKIYSASQRNDLVLAGLGEHWMITGNGYKPYACGVVLHPLIDAVIAVSRKTPASVSDIASVEVLVHPDVIRITGVDSPNSALMAKFSANHAAAVAFIDQAAGVAQFSDDRLTDAAVQALRRRVTVAAEPSFRLDQSAATVRTESDATYDAQIEHATGTAANPLTDEALRAKFLGNAVPIVGADRAQRIIETVATLETLGDVGELVRACA